MLRDICVAAGIGLREAVGHFYRRSIFVAHNIEAFGFRLLIAGLFPRFQTDGKFGSVVIVGRGAPEEGAGTLPVMNVLLLLVSVRYQQAALLVEGCLEVRTGENNLPVVFFRTGECLFRGIFLMESMHIGLLTGNDRLSPPANNGNPDEFDYACYLLRKGVSGTAYVRAGHWCAIGCDSTLTFRQQALECRSRLVALYRDMGFRGDESIGILVILRAQFAALCLQTSSPVRMKLLGTSFQVRGGNTRLYRYDRACQSVGLRFCHRHGEDCRP